MIVPFITDLEGREKETNLVLGQVWQPLAHHLHVGLDIQDQSDWSVGLVGSHGTSGCSQVALADLGSEASSKSSHLSMHLQSKIDDQSSSPYLHVKGVVGNGQGPSNDLLCHVDPLGGRKDFKVAIFNRPNQASLGFHGKVILRSNFKLALDHLNRLAINGIHSFNVESINVSNADRILVFGALGLVLQGLFDGQNGL